MCGEKGLDNLLTMRQREDEVGQAVDTSLDQEGKQMLVVVGGEDQVREHILKLADVEWMVRAAVVVAAVLMALMVAMAGELGLKNDAVLLATIVMMMGHNGVNEDNQARQANHYF